MTTFVDSHTSNNATTYIGFKSMPYAIIWWLVNGTRSRKTVCFSSSELVHAVTKRTQLTDGLTFEIEYPGGAA